MTPLQLVDLLGIFCFALSGSLLAATKRFDIVGSVFLGFLAGLGGGIIRDVVLDRGVPTAFAQPLYLLPPLLAALVVRVGWVHPGKWQRLILVADAAGLALFCVSGTLIALRAGMHPVGAALMGATTAAGGGLLRDVAANEVPQLVSPEGGLSAVPALLGAGLVAAMASLGLGSAPRFGLPELVIVAVVFGFRVTAVARHWQAPLAAAPHHIP